MRISNIELLSDAVAAPLAGFSDVGFRKVAASYGAGLTYTEMVSAKGLYYGSDKTENLLATAPEERVKAVQIFGGEWEYMVRACENPLLDKFDIIDINMGCPVPKVVKNNEGSALLNDIDNASKIVRECVNATNKPITVKFRKGFKPTDNIAVEFAEAMQSAGASAITVHGRTREQYYSGEADWESIALAVQAVNIPVIANGDVFNLEDYLAIKQATNADGVMIARGALGNPAVFKDIAEYQGVRTLFKDVDIRRDILTQIMTLKEHYSDRYIYSSMKKQICYYAKHRPESKRIKAAVCAVESVEELIDAVNRFFV